MHRPFGVMPSVHGRKGRATRGESWNGRKLTLDMRGRLDGCKSSLELCIVSNGFGG